MALRALAAAAAAAAAAADSLANVEHIVIFMQENRPFDFYYGQLRGVRGFGDRTAARLPSGRPVWYQPTDASNVTGGPYMLPFHTDTTTTSSICMPAPTMNYITDIAMWNGGWCDAWDTAREPGFGMAYFDAADMPYYNQLADVFTIGDHYHQSTFTQTNPNRLHLFSGSNGLSVGQAPILDNSEPTPGFTWPTAAEVLEAANISWRVYQEEDNFDDNGFSWFDAFQKAQPGSSLYDKGLVRAPAGQLVASFMADVQAGTLPQVSWIVGPTNQSEHATWHPSAGEDLSARLIAAFASNASLYSRAVFILNYDEGGQFFDHHIPYTPPQGPGDGVSTITVEGESAAGLPIGPGFRVPLFVISPWSRGGNVVSQVFDHTSTLQLIEQRFGVHFPTISAWRRAVMGDLLSALDFSAPNYDVSWVAQLPNTSAYGPESNKQCSTLPPPTVPAQQAMPSQLPGMRPSRALPYQPVLAGSVVAAAPSGWALNVSIANAGTWAVPLHAFDYGFPAAAPSAAPAPRKYAVGAGLAVSDAWALNATMGFYHIVLQAPNGFARQYAGLVGSDAGAAADVAYDVAGGNVVVQLRNGGATDVTFTVTDNAYATPGSPWTVAVLAGGNASQVVPVAASGNWYDLSITLAASAPTTIPAATSPAAWLRRAMGRMETGSHSTSDPAPADAPALHPFPEPAHEDLPLHLRQVEQRVMGLPSTRTQLLQGQAGKGVPDKDAMYNEEWLAFSALPK